jgi:hypothetical protein
MRHLLRASAVVTAFVVGSFALCAPAVLAETTSKAPSVVGTWQVNIKWTKGPAIGMVGKHISFTFNSNGTFDAGSSDGHWKQTGSYLKFHFHSGCTQAFNGRWDSTIDEFRGTQIDDCTVPPSSGVWNMRQ